MSDLIELEVHARYRHEQLLREAAEQRLLHLARRAEYQPRVAGQMLAWARRHLARWGARLQSVGAPATSSTAKGVGSVGGPSVGASVAGVGC